MLKCQTKSELCLQVYNRYQRENRLLIDYIILPLIGRQTLEVLGMLLIHVTGSLKSPNRTVKTVNKQQKTTELKLNNN